MTNQSPGTELDAAVAKALGGTYREGKPWECWDSSPRIRSVVEWPDGSVQEWYPSIRIDHAWEVVERLVAAGYDVELHWKEHRGSEAAFSLYSLYEFVLGNTMPHAICLAALAILEAAE